ncbi:MAG: ABC transporter permease [Bacilli bacterium]|nr:ABC transporter permease [Bacilli bacterium]
MTNKLLFLTKISLNKKIKTKWFLIANLIFAILIVGLINVDSIIKFFGGDFNETQEILVIDKVSVFDSFDTYYEESSKYLTDYVDTDISLYSDSYEEGLKLVEEEDKILLVISPDSENYIKAKVVSNEGLGNATNALISATLSNIRSELALNKYNITPEMYQDINKMVELEDVVLSEENLEDNLAAAAILPFLVLPLFMLIIFLVQMIGAEVNEEKTTKSMEIIISNVSSKTHFLSKVLSANLFVIIQGVLLIVFSGFGIVLRYIITDGNLMNGLDSEMTGFINGLSLNGVIDTIGIMLPIIIVMILLTFFAYSLLAGILASMTTNLEDFQQLQTPIVIISLIGFYLSMMSSMFTGSLFIKIMSYIPFISCLLSPILYIMGDIGLIDLVISIVLLIGTIYLLIKYGLRIYKVGILNYSQTGLWQKMFKAIKEK